MTTLTQGIAAVLGPTLVITTTSEALNLHIWKNIDPTVVYLNGLLFLIGGLVIVTNHFLWHSVAAGMVTVSGCLLIGAGALRMFFPATPQPASGPITYGLIAAVCMLGIALCVIAVGKR